MKMKQKSRLLYFVVFPITLIIVFIMFIEKYEYTAVAEFRESVTDINERDPLEYGKVLFETRGCSGCHAISPNVKNLGPNLNGIAQRQSEAYIRESIVTPEAVIAEGFSDITMPDFGEILNDNQVDALVKYVLSVQ